MRESNEAQKVEFPMANDGRSGLVIERTSSDGFPAVRVGIVIDGHAYRITLCAKDALGLALVIGDFAKRAADDQNAAAKLCRPLPVEAIN